MDDDRPDWRTDTAERPRVGGAPRRPQVPVTAPPAFREARVPPDAGEAPPPARFPLYADEYERDEPVDRPVEQPAEELFETRLETHLETQAEAPAEAPAERVEQPDWFSQAAEFSVASPPDDDRRSPVTWLAVALVVLLLVALGWWYFARADSSIGSAGQGGQHLAGAVAVVARHPEVGH